MGLGLRTRFDRWQRGRRRGGALAALLRVYDDRMRDAATLDDDWLRAVGEAWDNAEWSARPALLKACHGALRETDGDVLECGSGLSTLLMQAILRGSTRRIVTLENDVGWAARTRSALRQCGLRVDGLHVAPLKDYGEFDWYDVAPLELPPRFGFVLVDGPPGETRGNRRGVLDVVGDRIDERSLLVLDDANRAAEQRTLERWVRQAGARIDGPLPGQTHAWVRFPSGGRSGAAA